MSKLYTVEDRGGLMCKVTILVDARSVRLNNEKFDFVKHGETFYSMTPRPYVSVEFFPKHMYVSDGRIDWRRGCVSW